MTIEVNQVTPLQPILVVLVWRGGERFKRSLNSLIDSEQFFRRIVLSITSEANSDDVHIARQYLKERANLGIPSKAEIICSGEELPTMQHQAFWIDYLEETGAQADDWIFWLAYDDQIRSRGVAQIVDNSGNWPLNSSSIYLGPWAIRHESSSELWRGDCSTTSESWTCLPLDKRCDVAIEDWISQQILHPTYIQMSGSVAPLRNHKRLIAKWPRKKRPMRIEMATAAQRGVTKISEFPTPLTYIYGRSDSDRSAYGRLAYFEDLNLTAQLLREFFSSPLIMRHLCVTLARRVAKLIRRVSIREEWRVRESDLL